MSTIYRTDDVNCPAEAKLAEVREWAEAILNLPIAPRDWRTAASNVLGILDG